MFDSSLFFCNIEIFKVGKKEIIPKKNIVHTACESSYQAFINKGTNVICLASCLKMIDTKWLKSLISHQFAFNEIQIFVLRFKEEVKILEDLIRIFFSLSFWNNAVEHQ